MKQLIPSEKKYQKTICWVHYKANRVFIMDNAFCHNISDNVLLCCGSQYVDKVLAGMV